jgi:hypothetical protein
MADFSANPHRHTATVEAEPETETAE